MLLSTFSNLESDPSNGTATNFLAQCAEDKLRSMTLFSDSMEHKQYSELDSYSTFNAVRAIV